MSFTLSLPLLRACTSGKKPAIATAVRTLATYVTSRAAASAASNTATLLQVPLLHSSLPPSRGNSQRREYSSKQSASEISVYDFVLKQQQDAIEFFTDMCNRSQVEGFKRVFKMVLEDEVKHKEWVEKTLGAGQLGEIARGNFLRDAQNVFQLMKAEGIDLVRDIKELEELYRNIRDIKQQSRDWYTDRAIEAREHKVKALFQTIAEEEGVHVSALDNVLEFVGENIVNQNPRWSG